MFRRGLQISDNTIPEAALPGLARADAKLYRILLWWNDVSPIEDGYWLNVRKKCNLKHQSASMWAWIFEEQMIPANRAYIRSGRHFEARSYSRFVHTRSSLFTYYTFTQRSSHARKVSASLAKRQHARAHGFQCRNEYKRKRYSMPHSVLCCAAFSAELLLQLTDWLAIEQSLCNTLGTHSRYVVRSWRSILSTIRSCHQKSKENLVLFALNQSDDPSRHNLSSFHFSAGPKWRVTATFDRVVISFHTTKTPSGIVLR